MAINWIVAGDPFLVFLRSLIVEKKEPREILTGLSTQRRKTIAFKEIQPSFKPLFPVNCLAFFIVCPQLQVESGDDVMEHVCIIRF